MDNYKNKPTFLVSVSDDIDYDDFTSITDKKTIKNLAAEICNSLYHPITIVDINRLFDSEPESCRIESDVIFFSLRESCKLFRLFAGEKWCYECDKFHASCLIGSNSLEKNLEDVMRNAPNYFYNNSIQNSPRVLKNFPKEVIEYLCPMLGYRELIFPINVFGSVIGCLFLGQIVVKELCDHKNVYAVTRSFITKLYQHTYKTSALNKQIHKRIYETNKLIKTITTADKNAEIMHEFLISRNINSKYSMTFERQSEYYAFISKICESVDALEKKLVQIYKKRISNYFSEKMDLNVKKFFESLSKGNAWKYDTYSQKRHELRNAWNEFRNTADRIRADFNLKGVYLFGDGTGLKIEATAKKGIIPTPEPQSEEYKWIFDFSVINSKLYTDRFISSIEMPSILLGLSDEINKDNAVLLSYHSVAVLFIVDNLKKYELLYREMTNVIGDRLWKIATTISLFSANFMKEKHLLTLRMNRHESAHISTRLNDNLERYFSSEGQTFTSLSADKKKLVVEDIKNTIKLISHMANNIGIITGSINQHNVGKKIQLDVFDLLYKWQVMFRNELKDRNLDIEVLRNFSSLSLKIQHYDAPRYLFINAELFELLVYNLVDNAVKYAHRGSKIYLAWGQEENLLKLTVSSFGPKMDEGDSLYELYARGDIAQKHVASGDGIGLYVVKKISSLLNLNISHESVFIDKYHIPLVDWFTREQFVEQTDIDRQTSISAFKRSLEMQHVFDPELIINKSEYTCITRKDLSKEYLRKRIDRETWFTSFTVVVPKY